MYGAIVGDIIGSPFEFDQGNKCKRFELFSPGSHYTDDTVMTVAVAEALLDAGKDAELSVIRERVISSMRKWGRQYPHAGYGGRFIGWLGSRHPRPYGSYGNGSAMRVSAAGWLYDTLARTRAVAKATADVTHNHPEGIKGAEAVASVIFLARSGHGKDEIKRYVESAFHYDLSRSIDEIRPGYCHVESCQQTVPEAITAFLEGEDFEDVVRTAVSLGGDCDTLTDIAAAMAEAFYGMPALLQAEVQKRIELDMLDVVTRFDQALGRHTDSHDDSLDGNALLEAAISGYKRRRTDEGLRRILYVLDMRMRQNGHFLLPAQPQFDLAKMVDWSKVKVGDIVTYPKESRFTFCTIQDEEQTRWMVAFTSNAAYEKGESASVVLSHCIDWIFDATLQNDAVAGIVLNPWSESLCLSKDILAALMVAYWQDRPEQ